MIDNFFVIVTLSNVRLLMKSWRFLRGFHVSRRYRKATDVEIFKLKTIQLKTPFETCRNISKTDIELSLFKELLQFTEF